MDSDKRVDISVITPSIRGEDGVALVRRALKEQTFKSFEHIVQGREGSMEGNSWTFNQDMNTAIKKARGDLIISWQDYTYAHPDTLQRFLTHFLSNPNTLVGAVGNKYEDDSWTAMTWKDPRERNDEGSFYPCYFSDIEWNLCSVPRQAIYAVGGFDEEMDTMYGMDGFSVNDRLNILGEWDFHLDQSIKSYSLEHGRPDDWDKKNWNGKAYAKHREKYLDNPVLPYLSLPHGEKPSSTVGV